MCLRGNEGWQRACARLSVGLQGGWVVGLALGCQGTAAQQRESISRCHPSIYFSSSAQQDHALAVRCGAAPLVQVFLRGARGARVSRQRRGTAPRRPPRRRPSHLQPHSPLSSNAPETPPAGRTCHQASQFFIQPTGSAKPCRSTISTTLRRRRKARAQQGRVGWLGSGPGAGRQAGREQGRRRLAPRSAVPRARTPPAAAAPMPLRYSLLRVAPRLLHQLHVLPPLHGPAVRLRQRGAARGRAWRRRQ